MAEQFQNFFVTKLREACDATATTIYVETVPSITEGTLVLEYANSTKHEIIHFTGVSGYGLTGCTRGLEGTTAQSHSAGTDVRQNLTAGMIDKLINGVITTENIADGAVTADKIDFTTLKGEQFIGNYTSNSIVLPAGYQVYHIRGIANYNAPSANASMHMSYTNKTGTQFVRRLNLDAGGITYEEFNYTDGHLIIFGQGGTLAKTAGSIALNMTVIRKGTQIRAFCQWHHSGVQSCGYTTMEGNLASSSDAMTLAFVSSGRTFSSVRISVTGIRED